MLTAHSISKTYGIHSVLQNTTFSVSTGDRIGLIGSNGCGKSTLLRILAGVEKPDSGTVAHTRPGLRIGYLAQGFEFDPSLTLKEAITPSLQLEEQMVQLATALAADPSNQTLQIDYDNILKRISTSAFRNEEILVPLGLASLPPDHPISELSGGQKTRLMLARLLLEQPHLLLLDEPTNHLDIAMLEWLEDWLKGFHGAALIVSHDRTFLDNAVSSILELDPLSHAVKQYGGNYSVYQEQKEAERAHQMRTYLDQQAEIRRMKADISRTKQQAAFTEHQASSIRVGGSDFKNKGYKSYQQGIAKKVAAKAMSREKKLDRFLESDELVEQPRHEWQMKLRFVVPEHVSHTVLSAEALSIGYPGNPPLLRNLRFHLSGGERVALTGPNGCGKTTLLRTIAGLLDPASGRVQLGESVKLGYMAQEQELLDLSRSPLEIILESGATNPTRARSFLHAFLFSGDAPLRPCSEMSFGERSRLELALLIARGCTFLLLDEPINHLDIPSRCRFEQALRQFQGTVLAVVHDRTFIDHFANTSWVVEDSRIRINSPC
jgi:ATP-binding cassette, subfamily F, member 3